MPVAGPRKQFAGPTRGPSTTAPFPAGTSFPMDSTSGKGAPLTQADWDAVFDAAGVPRKTLLHSHSLQDASGNPVATVGTNFTAYGSPVYQQSNAGWNRLAIQLDANVAEGFGHAAATAPDAGTTSVLAFAYIGLGTSAGATRTFMSHSNAGTNNCRLQMVVTTGVMRVQCANVNVDGTTNYDSSAIRPFVLKYDRTNSAVVGYTDAEKVVGTYSAAVANSTHGFPADSATVGCRGNYALAASFSGANAEWSDATVKAVLQALGWTIPWS